MNEAIEMAGHYGVTSNSKVYLCRINAETVAARMQNNKNNHTATAMSSIAS
jgi:hypothetical protein